MIHLRDYQTQMLEDARRELREHRSVVIQSECGSGKGTVTTFIINGVLARGKRVLFLVHGKDRVADMDERVTTLGIPHGVLVGGRKRDRELSVQIASSDTVYRMEHKPQADLIAIDECHLGASPTFRQVLDCYPEAKLIGLSATPMLGSGRALGVKSGGVFESMVKGPSVTQLIREGFLVGSRVMAPPPPKDLAGLKKKRTGEFDGEQGAAICDNSKVIGDIVEHWKRYSSDRKTAVFAFNQKHAFDIAESFRAAGINWAYVDANTPDGDIHTHGTRKFFWHQMDHGDLVGVSSVGCINLGWDRPCCKSIILASKTASFPLYRQRLGRGSRPYQGYDSFLVLDHCANLYEHQKRGAFFESEVDWQLDGDEAVKRAEKDDAPSVSTCKVPLRTPADGVPQLFLGPLSPDGKWMLPCYSTFAAGPKQCPYCGLPIEVKTRKIAAEAGELSEIRPGELPRKSEAQIRFEERLRARYIELVRIGRRKGYKPGWPAMAFHLEFRRFPVKAWKQEALEMATE